MLIVRGGQGIVKGAIILVADEQSMDVPAHPAASGLVSFWLSMLEAETEVRSQSEGEPEPVLALSRKWLRRLCRGSSTGGRMACASITVANQNSQGEQEDGTVEMVW